MVRGGRAGSRLCYKHEEVGMNATMVASIVRHLLTAVGGGLAVKYGVDGESVDAIAGGAAALVGVVWAIVDKRQR